MYEPSKIFTAPEPVERVFTPDLARPSLLGLAYILRRENHWPIGFRWNYASEFGCALTIAHLVWPDYFPRRMGYGDRKAFGISVWQFLLTFDAVWDGGRTPANMARRLETLSRALTEAK